MYYKNNIAVEKSFDIVDTVRRKCGGERYYLLPFNINNSTTQMIELQFGNVPRIVDAYKNAQRKDGVGILISHE